MVVVPKFEFVSSRLLKIKMEHTYMAVSEMGYITDTGILIRSKGEDVSQLLTRGVSISYISAVP